MKILIGVMCILLSTPTIAQQTKPVEIKSVIPPQFIKCPRCGELNKWESEYCKRCGFPLKEAKRMILDSLKREETAQISPKGIKREVKALEVNQSRPENWGPSRLFLMPTTGVVSSYIVGFVGGGTMNLAYLGEENKQAFSPFLLANVGLGGVAELEINTIGTLTNLGTGVFNIPATSVKVRFFEQRGSIPSFAAQLRVWPTYTGQYQKLPVEYDTIGGEAYKIESSIDHLYRAGVLYGILGYKVNKAELFLGVYTQDNRYKKNLHYEYYKWDTLYGGYNYDHGKTLKGEEEQKIRYWFMGGLRVPVNPSTYIILEYENIPRYEFSEKGMSIIDRHTGMFGIRFYFLPQISIDAAGVISSEGFKGIADLIIHTNINLSFYFPDLVRLIKRGCLGG